MCAKATDTPALELLRQVLDGVPQLVKIVDRAGRLRYCNPPMAALLGLPLGATGDDLFELIDERVAAALRPSRREVFETGESTITDLEVEIGGATHRLSCTRLPLRSGGELYGVCTIAVDETERRGVERELARAHGQLRSMIDAFEDVLMLVDPQGVIQLVNYTITERPPEEVVGRSFYDYLAEPLRAEVRAKLERVVATRTPEQFANRFVDSAGNVTLWDVRMFPVVTGDEEVGLITVVGSNVTERRAREQEQERFFNITEDILCIIDPDSTFRRVNPAFEKVLGFAPDQVIGRPFIDWIHPDDREATLGLLSTARRERTGESDEIVNRYRHVDGSYRRIAWRAVTDPATGSGYGIGRDITEKHAFEEKLRQVQKMEAVGQLAGGIAHDFNNIALSILLNAELGLRSESGDVVPKSFREIRDAAQRAADLTRQLLAFSRQTVADFEYIDINHVTEGVMLLLRRLIPENIAVDFIGGQDLPAICADRGQLEQVIMNLCLNARDAMLDGGRIEIETAAVRVEAEDAGLDPDLGPGQHVALSVSDTGTGIDSAVIPRIFEPFFTTKPPGSGTGLGLATVYGVVQQHNGVIRVDSEPGVGTRFDIYLPATNRRVTRTVSEPARPVTGGTETILLAEDEALVRAVVVRTLTEAGYAVVVAKDGVEAVALAEANEEVALVLLDMVMPNMSGTQAYERIRELRPDVRVLFSSGYVGAMPYRRDGQETVPIIRKPYRPDELLREIRRILDE